MTISVRYYTRSGHTKKLAVSIANAVGVQAASIDVPLESKTDLLFLGCSYYAFDMDPAVKAFVAQNKDRISTIVCFGTSAMMKSMKKPMRKLTDSCGLILSEDEFHCRGEFKFANKGRPNENDLKNAALFAERIAKTYATQGL